MALVTIDFHNTLFRCDTWFRLEIADLPSEFLQWQTASNGASAGPELESLARQRYRELRQDVMATGQECDAVSSVWTVLNDLSWRVEREEVERGVKEIMTLALADASPTDGAVELTRRLDESGVRLAVVSSAAYHPFLEWCLARAGMIDRFSAIVTSASCGIYKSDPAIYQHTLALFGAVPEESVHIGDSHRFDVASASQVGMRTILLTGADPTHLEPQPDAVIRSLGEAGAHLVRLLPRPTAT